MTLTAWTQPGASGGTSTAFCLVLLDTDDGFAQGAVQGRVVGEVLAYRIADTDKFALDDALLCLSAGRKQHFAIAGGKASSPRATACDARRKPRPSASVTARMAWCAVPRAK